MKAKVGDIIKVKEPSTVRTVWPGSAGQGLVFKDDPDRYSSPGVSGVGMILARDDPRDMSPWVWLKVLWSHSGDTTMSYFHPSNVTIVSEHKND